MKKNTLLAVVLALVCAVSVRAGVPLSMNNFSFEDPDLADGELVVGDVNDPPQGWTYTYYIGGGMWAMYDPAGDGTGDFDAGIPDGDQVTLGLAKAARMGQEFDVNIQCGDTYLVMAEFGKSKYYYGTTGMLTIGLIPDVASPNTPDAHLAIRVQTPWIYPALGKWAEAVLGFTMRDPCDPDIGKDLQFDIKAQDNLAIDNVRLYKVTDTNWVYTGASPGDWATAGNWSGASVPEFSDIARIDNGYDASITTASQKAYRLHIDSGSTLTIGSGGELSLVEAQYPAIEVGESGDANLIIDGGTLYQGGEFGGDLRAGMVDGSTVHVEMKDGSWRTRCIRLGEAVTKNAWCLNEDYCHTTATVTLDHTGGIIDCNAINNNENGGKVYVGVSGSATATYNMSGGTLYTSDIVMCARGNADIPTRGTFNLQSGGTVVLFDDLIFGNDSNAPSISLFNQTGGSLTVRDDLKVSGRQGSSTYRISGGSLDAGEIIFEPGKGTFEIVGSGASSITTDNYTQNDISTLKVVIDSGGVTPISVTGSAVFDAGAVLDVTLGGGGGAGTYTILSATGGITDNGINNWGSECDHVTYAINGNNLDVTYHADSDPARCGSEPPDVCVKTPEHDYDDNCRVDFRDFAIIAGKWMECGWSICP